MKTEKEEKSKEQMRNIENKNKIIGLNLNT